MSNRSGFGKYLGSRLAAPSICRTICPCLIFVPRIRASLATNLKPRCRGVSYLLTSSIAEGSSDGFDLRSCSWSGRFRSVRIPFAIRQVVVSWPARSKVVQVDTSSASLSLSPCSSAVTSALIRSSPGSLRLRANISLKYSLTSSRFSCARKAMSGFAWPVPWMEVIALAQ